MAEKFRRRLESELTEGRELTVSIGVACFQLGVDEIDAEELVGRADSALYAAKQAGRNRVRSWSEEGTGKGPSQ